RGPCKSHAYKLLQDFPRCFLPNDQTVFPFSKTSCIKASDASFKPKNLLPFRVPITWYFQSLSPCNSSAISILASSEGGPLRWPPIIQSVLPLFAYCPNIASLLPYASTGNLIVPRRRLSSFQ